MHHLVSGVRETFNQECLLETLGTSVLPSLPPYLVQPLVLVALTVDIEGEVASGQRQDEVIQLDGGLLAIDHLRGRGREGERKGGREG